MGSETVTKWTRFIRQLVSDGINENDVMVGGENIIVEVEKTKLGKRKHFIDHRVEGVWVIAIERTHQKKL